MLKSQHQFVNRIEVWWDVYSWVAGYCHFFFFVFRHMGWERRRRKDRVKGKRKRVKGERRGSERLKLKEGRKRRESGNFKHRCSFLFQWWPVWVDKFLPTIMTSFITIIISSNYLHRQSFLGLENSTCNFEETQISPYHWTGKCYLKSLKSTFKLIDVK